MGVWEGDAHLGAYCAYVGVMCLVLCPFLPPPPVPAIPPRLQGLGGGMGGEGGPCRLGSACPGGPLRHVGSTRLFVPHPFSASFVAWMGGVMRVARFFFLGALRMVVPGAVSAFFGSACGAYFIATRRALASTMASSWPSAACHRVAASPCVHLLDSLSHLDSVVLGLVGGFLFCSHSCPPWPVPP